jgi:hypothetical protein
MVHKVQITRLLSIDYQQCLTWMVAPAAYQKGPATPYLYATLDDCSSVAAHVHLPAGTQQQQQQQQYGEVNEFSSPQ